MISLVTGATGFIGSRLVENLLDRGHQVYALVRNPARLNWLQSASGLTLLRGDLFSLPELPANLEVVFHLAGLTKALSKRDYYTVNQEGTASLLKKLEQSGLSPRFVHLSSLAAGSPSIGGKPASEDDPPSPASPYGHSKLLAEKEVLARKDRMEVIILRAAAIYGPRDQDFLQYFQSIKKGWLPTFSRPLVMSLCYVDDLVRAMIVSATASVESGRIYNVADPVPRTWEEIGLEAARILKKRVRIIKFPLWTVKMAAGASEVFARISGKPSPLNLSKYQELEKSAWVADVSKIKKELGFETVWPFPRAMEITISWYLENGWL